MPTADSLMCPPQFIQSLTDLLVKDGEALNLNCSVKGDPEPNITWSKNGEVKIWINHNKLFSSTNWLSYLIDWTNDFFIPTCLCFDYVFIPGLIYFTAAKLFWYPGFEIS